jgi:hypothetical protein
MTCPSLAPVHPRPGPTFSAVSIAGGRRPLPTAAPWISQALIPPANCSPVASTRCNQKPHLIENSGSKGVAESSRRI